jgi:hypothetical protein
MQGNEDVGDGTSAGAMGEEPHGEEPHQGKKGKPKTKENKVTRKKEVYVLTPAPSADFPISMISKKSRIV